MSTLTNKVILITGASRGIGREIALRCAEDGASIVLAAKTVEAHPKLPGSIVSVAKEVEQSGGRALPLALDIRDEKAVQQAVTYAAETLGGIDILVNNASAISLSSTMETSSKRFDLMMSVNARGSFLCAQACIPYLKCANNPHILSLSPPLTMHPKWFKSHLAYTLSKYGMSMCTLGMAEEFKQDKIAVNSLWPKTTIATAAIEFNFAAEILRASRKPRIVADAAYLILTSDSATLTGQFLIDEEVLRQHGCTDFSEYAIDASVPLHPDYFLDTVE